MSWIVRRRQVTSRIARLGLALLLTATLALSGLLMLAIPASAAPLQEYDLGAGSRPFAIATGSDGAMWFTEAGSNKIGRITATGRAVRHSRRARRLAVVPRMGRQQSGAVHDGGRDH